MCIILRVRHCKVLNYFHGRLASENKKNQVWSMNKTKTQQVYNKNKT